MRRALNYLKDLIGVEAGPSVDTTSTATAASTSDYQRLVSAGNDYASLLLHPGYQRLLDDLEAEADKRLSALKFSISADPAVTHALKTTWASYEAVLLFIQERAQQAVEDKKAIITAMSEDGGLAEDISDDASGSNGSTGILDDFDLMSEHSQSTINFTNYMKGRKG